MPTTGDSSELYTYLYTLIIALRRGRLFFCASNLFRVSQVIQVDQAFKVETWFQDGQNTGLCAGQFFPGVVGEEGSVAGRIDCLDGLRLLLLLLLLPVIASRLGRLLRLIHDDFAASERVLSLVIEFGPIRLLHLSVDGQIERRGQ